MLINIIFSAEDKNPELLSDIAMELGAMSVSISNDNKKKVNIEKDWFDEPREPKLDNWDTPIITVLFDSNISIKEFIKNLENLTTTDKPIKYRVEPVDDIDWVKETQRNFKPIEINNDLWIIPSWCKPVNPEGINLFLDPANAFGTGTHPTTFLCLDWLSKNVKGGESVLDYGCGSGILAIAAKKLGAGSVFATDIDPTALKVTESNANNNKTKIQIHAVDDHIIRNEFDIVIANILARPLITLTPRFAKLTKTGGKITLSGILENQWETVSKNYARYFYMKSPVFKDDWVLLTGVHSGV